jgi:hypothetical protein
VCEGGEGNEREQRHQDHARRPHASIRDDVARSLGADDAATARALADDSGEPPVQPGGQVGDRCIGLGTHEVHGVLGIRIVVGSCVETHSLERRERGGRAGSEVGGGERALAEAREHRAADDAERGGLALGFDVDAVADPAPDVAQRSRAEGDLVAPARGASLEDHRIDAPLHAVEGNEGRRRAVDGRGSEVHAGHRGDGRVLDDALGGWGRDRIEAEARRDGPIPPVPRRRAGQAVEVVGEHHHRDQCRERERDREQRAAHRDGRTPSSRFEGHANAGDARGTHAGPAQPLDHDRRAAGRGLGDAEDAGTCGRAAPRRQRSEREEHDDDHREADPERPAVDGKARVGLRVAREPDREQR